MKTTVNIPDGLFRKAKAFCAENAITLTELVQKALQDAISSRGVEQGTFKLADGRFKGELGLRPGIDPADWATIRDLTYEGRGS
ncbi:MAG TPA: hypothetical protein VMI31_15230 [Fimbriimonadaceae bacterium]|nr:hypothetical protein [Fimbriimonadaceae bacterium]